EDLLEGAVAHVGLVRADAEAEREPLARRLVAVVHVRELSARARGEEQRGGEAGEGGRSLHRVSLRRCTKTASSESSAESHSADEGLPPSVEQAEGHSSPSSASHAAQKPAVGTR